MCGWLQCGHLYFKQLKRPALKGNISLTADAEINLALLSLLGLRCLPWATCHVLFIQSSCICFFSHFNTWKVSIKDALLWNPLQFLYLLQALSTLKETHLQDVLNIHAEPDSALIVLGASDSASVLKRGQSQLIFYSLITDRKFILTFWKKKNVPIFQPWLNDMTITPHLKNEG